MMIEKFDKFGINEANEILPKCENAKHLFCCRPDEDSCYRGGDYAKCEHLTSNPNKDKDIKYTSWKIRDKIEKIIDSNCEEVEYEGTTVNK